MGEREFRHIIVYHPDRLLRQPRDLEELLTISDDMSRRLEDTLADRANAGKPHTGKHRVLSRPVVVSRPGPVDGVKSFLHARDITAAPAYVLLRAFSGSVRAARRAG